MAFGGKTLQRVLEDLTNNGKERFSTDQAPAMTTNTGHQLFHSSAKKKTVNKAIDSARESVKFTLRNRPGEFPPPGGPGKLPPGLAARKRRLPEIPPGFS